MKKVREGYKKYEFGEIPSNWEVKTIGDIFPDLRAGSTPSRKIEEYYTGNIPWISSGELKYKKIYETLENITEQAVRDTNLEIYPKGTFFIAITGLEAEGTRGSCAISEIKATTNQSCMAFKPKHGFSNLYLYYWYRLYGDYIGLKYTQGTKQQSLNNKIVQELEIPVPSLKEQEKIALILSTVDEQIDIVDGLIQKNKELKKGLMQQLLTKGIGHTKFKMSEVGEIPDEWEVKKLKEISAKDKNSIVDGPFGSNLKTDDYVEDGILVMQSNYITGGKFELRDTRYITLEKATELDRSKVKGGEILMAKIGANFGAAEIIPNKIRYAILSSNCLKIDLNSEVASNLFYLYILKFYRECGVISKLASITAQPALSLKSIKDLKVAIPKLGEQEKIVSILSTVDSKIEVYEIKRRKLEDIKKGLMQQLLTGKVRVK